MPQALSSEAEKLLGRIIQGEDRVAAIAARNELVLSKIGFVHHLIRSVKMPESLRDDLLSEALLELIRAAETWNPNHEPSAFAEYAKVLIRHRIWRFFHHGQRRFEDLTDIHPDGSCSPEHVMSIREEAEQHWPLVQTLPPVQRYVFAQTLGLLDGVPRTSNNLAREMNLNPSRVKDLYLQACSRLKHRYSV
jgi:RNA polymerase sigma factor (sigma-70 family)